MMRYNDEIMYHGQFNMAILTHLTLTYLFPLLLLLATPLPGAVCIRITDMQVASVAKVGSTVHLACRFDLEGANLYSLTWWRGADQFYQFSPSNAEPIIVYHAPGIMVDERESRGETVVLHNISHASSGKFKCEVLEDYPSFQKDSQVKNMQVVEEPNSAPLVSLSKLLWSPREELIANCTSPLARPMPQLQWYINDIQVPSHHSSLVSEGESGRGKNMGVMVIDGWSTVGGDRPPTTSMLTLVLRETHFTGDGRAILKCDATYKGIYHRWSEVQLTTPWYKTAAPSQRLYGNTVSVMAAGFSIIIPIICTLLL